MRKDTQSPKQEQSVALQNGPWSKQKTLKKNFFSIVPFLNIIVLCFHNTSLLAIYPPIWPPN